MKTKNTGPSRPRTSNDSAWLVWVASAGCLAAASLAGGGCELIASVDPDLLNEGGGGGTSVSSTGTSVTSSTTTTTTGSPTSSGSSGGDGGQGGTGGAGGEGGSGGVGGTGGEGGAGGGVCDDPEQDCDDPGECQAATCEDGECGITVENEGVACDNGGDEGVCNATGDCVECLTEVSCPAPAECQVAVCDGGLCDTVDAEDGIDCVGGTTCLDGVCQVPLSCDNDELDTGETDIDCGGGNVTNCPLCEIDDDCLVAGDCETGFCDLTTLPNPTCQPCGGNGDCAAGEYCDDVTDICVADQANGATCGDGAECTSTFCVDGFCCGEICDGDCEACSATGTCDPVADGTDIADDCSDTAECLTGVCDALGACEVQDTDTECGAGPTCTAGQEFEQGTCGDGTGLCEEDATGTSCGLFDCGATECLDTCSDNGDCVTPGNFCEGTTCTATKANGVACGVGGGDPNDECTSGNCIDGFCCNSACGGACDACNLAGAEGACTPRPDNTAGSPACPDNVLCDGSVGGLCPAICLGDGDCAPNRYCAADGDCDLDEDTGVTCDRDGMCASGDCTATLQCACDDDTDCAANQFCDDVLVTGGTQDCVPDHGSGGSCDEDTDCTTTCTGIICN